MKKWADRLLFINVILFAVRGLLQSVGVEGTLIVVSVFLLGAFLSRIKRVQKIWELLKRGASNTWNVITFEKWK